MVSGREWLYGTRSNAFLICVTCFRQTLILVVDLGSLDGSRRSFDDPFRQLCATISPFNHTRFLIASYRSPKIYRRTCVAFGTFLLSYLLQRLPFMT
jgi:hypothetical protein